MPARTVSLIARTKPPGERFSRLGIVVLRFLREQPAPAVLAIAGDVVELPARLRPGREALVPVLRDAGDVVGARLDLDGAVVLLLDGHERCESHGVSPVLLQQQRVAALAVA